MSDVWASLVTSGAAVLVGGLTRHFNLFLEPPPQFRERVKSQRREILTRLAGRHADILRDLERSTDEPLRSFVVAPKSAEPDKIDRYTSELLRVFNVFIRFREMESRVRNGHAVLLLTTLLGLVGLILAWLVPPSRSAVLVGGLATIAAQAITICIVFFSARTLDDYEDIT